MGSKRGQEQHPYVPPARHGELSDLDRRRMLSAKSRAPGRDHPYILQEIVRHVAARRAYAQAVACEIRANEE